jgi:hypothetical protein
MNEAGTSNDILAVEQESQSVAGTAAVGKKPFVEPEVTFPIDVLDATTFFQVADSGATP